MRRCRSRSRLGKKEGAGAAWGKKEGAGAAWGKKKEPELQKNITAPQPCI